MPDSFKCEVCGDEFDSSRGLSIHKGRMHSEEEIDEAENDQEEIMEEEKDDNEAEASDQVSEEESSEEASEDEQRDISEVSKSFSVNLSLKSAVAVFFFIGIFSGFALGLAGLAVSPDIQVPELNLSSDSGDFQSVDLGNISLEDEPSLGSDEASIKVIQYTDFACPFCGEWHGSDASNQINIDSEENFQKLKTEYIDKGDVEFIVKDHPVPDVHPNSVRAHAAANCVYRQSEDDYWDFTDRLYETRDTWTAEGGNTTSSHFESLARETSIDTEQFLQCYLSTDGSEMAGDRNNALRNIGEIGTPTFIIGNEKNGFVLLSGAQPLEEFEKAFENIA